MTQKFVRKTRLIFPVMIIFLILYLLASPEKILNKTVLFRNSTPFALPSVKEKEFKPSKNQKKNYVPDEVIIRLAYADAKKIGFNPDPKNTGLSKLDELNASFQVTSMSALSSKENNLRPVYRLMMANQNTEKAVRDYQDSGIVEYSEPNYKAREYVTNPDDPKFVDGTQWNLNQLSNHDINAPEGWDFETGSADTMIAVIDSGVDLDHPDLINKIWHNAAEVAGDPNVDDDDNGYIDDFQGWDWVTSYENAPADNDPNPEPDGINNDGWYGVDDGVEHGTHVAGIAAAETNNGTGIAGVCWGCQIMALRVLDDEGWGSYTDIAEAIEYAADNGADVINMSLGGGYSNLLDDAIKYAYSNDVVVVAAAGNSGLDLNQSLASPVCNDGNENRVIGVAGTDSDGEPYYGSNYGYNYVDAAAPGQSIYSTVYHNAAFGFNNWYEGGWTGTSMASPHVAGLAGLVKSAHPTWIVAQVRNRVINLTKNIDLSLGSRAKLFGSGEINLGRALNPDNNIYPDGTLVRISGYSTVFFLLRDGQRRKINAYFRNKYLLAGANFVNKNAIVSEEMVLNYPKGPEIRWADGTLFKYYYNHYVRYVIEDGRKRRFSNSDAFYDAGYDLDNLITALKELNYYKSGPTINSFDNIHVSGTVIKSPGDNNYYYIHNGKKYPFDSISYMRYYGTVLPWAINVTDEEKNSYVTGDTLRYPGGIMVGDSDTGNIYMIEYNKRRFFVGGEANVTNLGFSTASIIWSDWKADGYPDGDNMPTSIAAQ
jgi:subtilisin family serine protease